MVFLYRLDKKKLFYACKITWTSPCLYDSIFDHMTRYPDVWPLSPVFKPRTPHYYVSDVHSYSSMLIGRWLFLTGPTFVGQSLTTDDEIQTFCNSRFRSSSSIYIEMMVFKIVGKFEPQTYRLLRFSWCRVFEMCQWSSGRRKLTLNSLSNSGNYTFLLMSLSVLWVSLDHFPFSRHLL